MLLSLCYLSLLVGPVLSEQGLGRRMVSMGAVLSSTGLSKGMVDARRGYQLGVAEVNKLNNRQGFRVMDNQERGYYVKLHLDALDDNANKTLHNELVGTLLDKDREGGPVDFLLGSHPEYALDETRMADRARTINVQCCVGPDEIYDQGIPYVFGVPVSNKRYTELAIQSFILKNLKNIAIISEEENIFTSSTCGAAKDLVMSVQKVDQQGPRIVLERTYPRKEGIDGAIFDSIVKECIDNHVDAVVACSFEQDGMNLVKAFHAQRKSMKAFFMTVGPTRENWIAQLGNMSDYLLSAGQWHPDLPYSDNLFGSIDFYLDKYHKMHGADAHVSYVSVGASTAVHIIMKSIQIAFRPCDLSLTFGDVDQLLYNATALNCSVGSIKWTGYERVRQAMQHLNLQTIYGRIKFNNVRRNIGSDPVTVQVLNHHKNGRAAYAVLPVGTASAELVIPAKNAYRPTCKPGYYVGPDDFDPCQLCVPGESSSMDDADHCDRCNVGLYNSKSGQKECSPCPKGTTTYERGSSRIEECHCKPGFYNVEKSSGLPCILCPQGADCQGGESPPAPLPGFWMNSSFPSEAYACDPEDACTGIPDNVCKEGRQGRTCAECVHGYYNIINYCIGCPSKMSVVALIIAVVLGWYILNVVISKNVASMEMMLSWAQLANIIGDVGLRWPGSLRTMFAAANILDFDVDILEPSCLFPWSYHHNFVVQLMLPFFMSLMAYLGYLASCIAFSCRNKSYLKNRTRLKWWLGWLVSMPHVQADLSAKWDATIAAFLSSVEVTYITVTKYCFDAFKCEYVGGVSVLRSDPSVDCHTNAHTRIVVLGVIGVLGYGVGYIAFVWWTMWSINAARSFREPQNLRRYGFLYRHFELDYFWTPVVNLLRRLLFVVILVFMNNPALQAGALAIIINISLMLQVYTAPYVDTYLDVIFSFLLVTLMFEAFSGVLFYSSNLPSADRAILETIVLLALFVLIGITVVFLLLELRQKYHHHVVKSMHCKDVLRRKRFFGSSSKMLSVVSLEYKEAMKEVSNELLETFNSQFLYTALTKHPQYIEDWDKLTLMLKDFMSDKAECSYLSRDPIAKFWRKLVDRFPELIDFLAVASEESREQFRGFATTLYRNFYLTNKVQRLPIYGILNWRDRAPMAQWLALASESDRRFFTRFMSDLFKEVDLDLATYLDRKVETQGVSFSLDIDRTNDSRSWWSKTMPTCDGLVLSEITSGRDPLEANQTSFRSRATQVEAMIRLKSSDRAKKKKSVSVNGASEQGQSSEMSTQAQVSPTDTKERDHSESPMPSRQSARSESSCSRSPNNSDV